MPYDLVLLLVMLVHVWGLLRVARELRRLTAAVRAEQGAGGGGRRGDQPRRGDAVRDCGVRSGPRVPASPCPRVARVSTDTAPG
jgi:hypothetical protein